MHIAYLVLLLADITSNIWQLLPANIYYYTLNQYPDIKQQENMIVRNERKR